jgi:hypothetical protein
VGVCVLFPANRFFICIFRRFSGRNSTSDGCTMVMNLCALGSSESLVLTFCVLNHPSPTPILTLHCCFEQVKLTLDAHDEARVLFEHEKHRFNNSSFPEVWSINCFNRKKSVTGSFSYCPMVSSLPSSVVGTAERRSDKR